MGGSPRASNAAKGTTEKAPPPRRVLGEEDADDELVAEWDSVRELHLPVVEILLASATPPAPAPVVAVTAPGVVTAGGVEAPVPTPLRPVPVPAHGVQTKSLS